jgi:hypothetical protein
MAFDADLEAAHRHCSNHRRAMLSSESCGCFFCLALFTPVDIRDWIDSVVEGLEGSAICPRCGIDAVIGSTSGLPLNQEFLSRMHEYWFEEPSPLKP